ncbi:glycosyltransferase family 39 protein [Candidatus Saccharibacteria bacterium]|nr:glycosyltransferase family 39 protein [Candidatus Saccharibacteria bacterium]
MKQKITSYALYRWRYLIGYLSIGSAIFAALIFAVVFVPGGIRLEEKIASVKSGSLQFYHFDPQTVIDLPYHIIQRASFALFDVSSFSIKLPSLIFGVATIIGIYVLLAIWLKRNVALITTGIAATMPIFLFTAQDGTPTMYHFAVSFWLLLSAMLVSRRYKPTMLWKVLFFVFLALNIYTPLGIYLDLAVITTVIAHPHIRFLTRKLNPNRVIIAAIVALLTLVPLIYSIVLQPKLALQLLGFPGEILNLQTNLLELLKDYVGFVDAGSGSIARPMFSIGVFLVIAIGLYRFIIIKYTARSYVVWFWIACLVPIIILSPQYSAYVYPIAVLMVGMGIDLLLREWYKLFPHNPYARMTGLLPLGLIVAGLIASGSSMYVTSYHYIASTSGHFDNDLTLLQNQLSSLKVTKEKPALVVVPESQVSFVELVSRYDQRFSQTSKQPSTLDAPYTLIAHDSYSKRLIKNEPSKIITSSKSQNSDRFYLYTKPAQ